MMRLLIARGLTRAAKSASEVKAPFLRSSTICHRLDTDTLQGGQRVVDRVLSDLEGGGRG
jgi:hypothetical protein